MTTSPRQSFLSFLPLVLSLVTPLWAETVILDMDTLRHKPLEVTKDGQKVPIGTAEGVEGKIGKAVKFTFIDQGGPGFFTASPQGTPEWDAADGFSFWVKGDGSANWGGIQFIDKDDYALRCAYCFPIDSSEWKKIVVRWSDLTPELAGPLVNAQGGYKPSSFGSIWFGKWFEWRTFPGHSYTIDQIALEEKIGPAVIPEGGPGLKRLKEKLAAKTPITLVTLGDSLTDTAHWANRKTVWAQLTADAIKAKYGSDVKLINPALGGTTLSQNLVLLPRWSKEAPEPDLVTVWFGFNDWDSGVRGERFGEYMSLAVDRIRRQTNGKADILLMTTCPAFERWETGKELEEAVMKVAKEKNVAVVDIAAEFRKAGSADEARKRGYWVDDNVHLGPAGHELVKDAVLGVIGAGE